MFKNLTDQVNEDIELAKKAKKDLKMLNILETRKSGSIEDVEDTTILTQDDIKQNIPLIAAEKGFSIDLKNGPFFVNYLKNGRHLLLHNKMGYLASFDVKTLNLNFERNIHDKIHDAIFLHNELFCATAQKNNVFIYNQDGVEVHCCRENRKAFKLEFLPYHFLLVSLSSEKFLRYQDTSTGQIIANIFTKENNLCMTQNKKDALIYLGNDKGLVSLWSPNSKEYLCKIFCAKGTINSIEVEKNGLYFITSSTDKSLNIFDIRNSYKPINSIKTNFSIKNMNLSDNQCLGLNFGKNILIYKNIFTNPEKYLTHFQNSFINDMKFCSYEDILTLGTNEGINNLIIPGSGNPIFDSYEDTPFYTKKQRSEMEVKRLLEKIPYTFIGQKDLFKSTKKVIQNTKGEFKRYFEQTDKTPLERIFPREE